jgi:hypothetical protein
MLLTHTFDSFVQIASLLRIISCNLIPGNKRENKAIAIHPLRFIPLTNIIAGKSNEITSLKEVHQRGYEFEQDVACRWLTRFRLHQIAFRTIRCNVLALPELRTFVRNFYSHSIVAIVLCVLPCVISCHLVRLFSSSPNHFVIRWVITNHRIPDSNADSCDDSLATIPDFVNGNSIGRFAVRRFGQNRHSYSLGDFL